MNLFKEARRDYVADKARCWPAGGWHRFDWADELFMALLYAIYFALLVAFVAADWLWRHR